MKYLLFLLLFLPNLCLGDSTTSTLDVLPTTNTPQDTTVLNNALRQNQTNISLIGAYFSSAGVLSPGAGGTGDAKSIHVTGNMYYDDGADFFQNVGIGTSTTVKGYFLANNGATAPTWNLPIPSQSGNTGKFLTTDGSAVAGVLSWGSAGLKFVSANTVSSAGAVTISITNTKSYLARYFFTSSTGQTLTLQFNGDGAANKYADAIGGTFNRTSIRLTTTTFSGVNYIDLYVLAQYSDTALSQYCYGTILSQSNSSFATGTFGGAYANTAATTNFTITASSGSMTGNLYLYEYAQS